MSHTSTPIVFVVHSNLQSENHSKCRSAPPVGGRSNFPHREDLRVCDPSFLSRLIMDVTLPDSNGRNSRSASLLKRT